MENNNKQNEKEVQRISEKERANLEIIKNLNQKINSDLKPNEIHSNNLMVQSLR